MFAEHPWLCGKPKPSSLHLRLNRKCQEPYFDTYGDSSVEAYTKLVLFLGKMLIKANSADMFKEFIFSVLASDAKI